MAIVRNIQNNGVYRYIGDNKFVNVVTGQEGTVGDEMAAKVFKINVGATEMISEYPIVEDFIKSLGLKFDNNKK